MARFSTGWNLRVGVVALVVGSAVGASSALGQSEKDSGVPVVGPDDPAPASAEEFRFRLGERAVIERLPRANGRVVEMYARNVDPSVDLAALFRGNTRHISAMHAVESGGGVWLLRATVRQPDSGEVFDLDVAQQGADAVFRVVPATRPPARGREPAPTLGQLISGEIPEASPVVPPATVFRVLPGDAIADKMDAWEYDLAMTRSPSGVLAASWDRVDNTRRRMLRARPGTPAHQEYMYYLGYYYLALGFGREARYYFSRLSARPGPVPQRDIALDRARAELACGNYDEARQWYSEAFTLGADHDSVLEGLAVISLQTGQPARAPTARLIWASTSASAPLMLAAELLQIDGRVAESRDILESINTETLSPEQRTRHGLRLGDARFYDRYEGNVEEAAVAWSDAGPELGRARDLFLELHQTGTNPKAWATLIPGLVQASMQRSDAGAEALYLLSQIDMEVGSREDAINDLALVLRRYPNKASGSDVPERFWRLYSDYISDLADAERWFDIAALHESVWSPTVRRAVRAPEALVHVARAYEEVGLPVPASRVLGDAVQVLTDRGLDDPRLVFHLAELYIQTGEGVARLPEPAATPHDPDFVAEEEEAPSVFGSANDRVWQAALDTLDYLREKPHDEIPNARIDLLEARAHVGREDLTAAAESLRRASRDPEYRDVASLRLALLDASAGRCDRAVPALQRLAVTGAAQPLMEDSRPWLALARCYIADNRVAAAADAARTAARLAGEQLERLAEAESPKAGEATPTPASTVADASEPSTAAGDSLSRRGLADIANARSATLRGELRGILEAELQYATGLAATAEGWQDPTLIDKLQERGGIWSAMADEYRDDREFGDEVDERLAIPWK